MKKMTKMILISAVFVTSGLTAKIANENYKTVVDNDERIHKAYELAKKPNKAAVLEAIVDATNAEPDERIQNAVVIDPEEPKMVRIKTKVTTSAGVSPISSVMDKKTVNKDEEFIGNIMHPVNIPDCNIPIQKLTYEVKDIFPEFEEVEKETLTYKIENIIQSYGSKMSLFQSADGTKSYGVNIRLEEDLEGDIDLRTRCAVSFEYDGRVYYDGDWHYYDAVDQSDIGLSVAGSTIDYSGLALKKDDATIIRTTWEIDIEDLSYKGLYEIFSGIENGTYTFKGNFDVHV